MRKSLLTCLVLVISIPGFSQGFSSAGNGGSGGSLGLSFSTMPERKLKDTTGGYSYHTFGVNARIPLFSIRSKEKHFFQASLTAEAQFGSASYGFIKTDRSFVNGSAGLNAMSYSGGKNVYIMSVSMGAAADNDVLSKSNTRYRFSGAFIVNHQHSSRTMYQYGGIFTYAYGRPLPLPVLGLRTKLSTNWTFSTLLPVSVEFVDKLSSDMRLTLAVRPAGNRYQFDNQSNFATSSSTLFLQLRDFQLGATLHYDVSKSFSLMGEAGLLVGGKLKFTEQDDPKTIVYQSNVQTGAQLRISARLRFGGRKGGNSKMDSMLSGF